ncbi:MAG TPA: hypothetical protein VG406_09540 [Isosphaeraceae bacterium]|jgi:hypothetical protein|nr:hypothetical protein [Isosphaeraceae bacterium]
MRGVRSQPWIRAVLLVAAIVAVLVALRVWAYRPPSVPYVWGLEGRPADAPIPRLAAWARGDLGDRTPATLLTLLWLPDALIAAASVAVLVALVLLLARPGLGRRSVARLARLNWRLRTAMIGVAVIALALGAWQRWASLQATSERHGALEAEARRLAEHARATGETARGILRSYERFGDGAPPGVDAAGFARQRERYRQLAAYDEQVPALLRDAAYHAELKEKFRRAAAHPWLPVGPDPPPPRPRDPEPPPGS